MRPIDADHLRKWILSRWTMWNPDSEYPLKASEILDQIDRENTVTFEDYARAEGYSIIKKKPMPKLKPCPKCGSSGRKIEEWVCRTGYFYICSECNHQSKPARSERKARENWNETD